jgi:ABC-type transport system substrate-binding protein
VYPLYDHATLKRRDDWKWGPSGVTASDLPQTLVVRVVPNDTTAANLLLTGGLDIAQINGPDVTRLLAEKSLISKTSTSFYNNPLYFNEDPSRPTGDRKVREALASAIDRDQFNQAADQGHGTLSSSYLQPNADCFEPATANLLPTDPSPARARQLLVADGCDDDHLAARFARPEHVDSDVHRTASSRGSNYGKTVNPEAEAALTLARQAQGADRCAQWSTVQKAMIQNFDILPLSAPQTFFFSRGLDFVPASVNGFEVYFIRASK